MKKYVLFLFIVVLSTGSSKAQEMNDAHIKTIKKFIESYNSQDYGNMRKNFSTVLKLVLTKKRIKQLYGYQYEMLGNAKITNIYKRSEKSYFIDLAYDRDTTEIQKIGLSLSRKNKIIGMFNPKSKFIFNKSENPDYFDKENALKQLDSIFELKHAVANFNGCLVVIKDKKEFYKKCAGMLEIDENHKLNENTLFDLASCSKQFTAMAIMILKEKGKLLYNDKVEKYFPDFPYKEITIENLLTHTSGLPDYMPLFEKYWDKSKIATNRDVLDLLIKYKPKMNFKPGSEYEYCNTGYVVLSSIIEEVSGQPFSEFISQSIFKPLSMNNSRVYNTRYSKNEILENRASGHSFSTIYKKYLPVQKMPELDYYKYLDGINGDGAVNSSINELILWDNGIRENALIKEENFRDALNPYKISNGDLSHYGYGWELQKDDKYERVIYHSGSWGGNTSFILHFLDKDLSVIILSNNEYINIEKFALKVAKIMNK